MVMPSAVGTPATEFEQSPVQPGASRFQDHAHYLRRHAAHHDADVQHIPLIAPPSPAASPIEPRPPSPSPSADPGPAVAPSLHSFRCGYRRPSRTAPAVHPPSAARRAPPSRTPPPDLAPRPAPAGSFS